jgi:hypothetical protein
MWLGYGNTFPKVRPDSWKRAGEVHKSLAVSRPPKPKAKLAVVRSYTPWSLTNYVDGKIVNPGDWMLQQFLEVWSVEKSQPYDVFEVPPSMSRAERDRLSRELSKYPYVVSNEQRSGAWVIGAGLEGQAIHPSSSIEIRRKFAVEIAQRGWCK